MLPYLGFAATFLALIAGLYACVWYVLGVLGRLLETKVQKDWDERARPRSAGAACVAAPRSSRTDRA